MRPLFAVDPLVKILYASWDVVVEAAPWMLLGILVAGLLKTLLPDDMVARHLGPGSRFAVLKAALLGVPIPLCSCGVLPAAAGLRKQGAGKGAAAAFLVATPETGVDSIAVTYALLDPLMTLLRPLAALVTALVTGYGVSWLDRREKGDRSVWAAEKEAAPAETGGKDIDFQAGASGGSAAPSEAAAPLGPIDLFHPLPPETDAGAPGCAAPDATIRDRVVAEAATGSCGCGHCCTTVNSEGSRVSRLGAGLRYALWDLAGDIGPWFLGGAVLAGGFTALMPPHFLAQSLGTGIWSMVAALLASLPLYVCATASTPLVAALALKGLSPGAALVFLLAGPATNAATVAVVASMLGRRAAALYVAAIALCSLGLGLVANELYARLGLNVSSWVTLGGESGPGLFGNLAAGLLLLLFAIAWLRQRLHKA
ncbi:Protein of unknown function DUF318, transmembrane [Desulfovibrio sp. X2]|uniref:SO_0444 family Cu/Zn efflux transporter n=1 Tax=Desulfovibrio sp. X2 TaxID=941449 RepID=UPI0003587374|nr:SO_0444 family Cu/Zn efflux transporter [Desulfovibrio sp. X2]EPR43717.1 Protein of unknown function DUF318, transmembrane [Desulfovibrio sp. X2]